MDPTTDWRTRNVQEMREADEAARRAAEEEMRSELERPRRTLEEFFSERYSRLEQLEDAVRQAPNTAKARQRLDLIHRAKFSTWMDLEALGGGGGRIGSAA